MKRHRAWLIGEGCAPNRLRPVPCCGVPGDRRKTSNQGREWLPKDKSGGSRKRKSSAKSTAAADARQWLPAASKQNGASSSATKDPSAEERVATRRQPRSRLSRARLPGTQREARLQSKVRRAADKIASQQAELTKLRQRIEELEAEVAQGGAAKKAAKPRRSVAKAGSGPSKARGASKRGKRDLNDLTFEQLREIGLSVTQSARLTAAREARGGFDSIDQLDEIPGLSKKTVEGLKDQLRVG